MRKQTLEASRERTHETVSQITCWCLLIGMHQKYGIGRQRQDRVVKKINWLRSEYMHVLATSGKVADGLRWLREQLPEGAAQEFRVPLNRWLKNRTEEQLLMAANKAATISWLLFAVASHQVLGFGVDRLNGLHDEGVANYRQFNEWQQEDPDWALENLRRCAEAALREKLELSEEVEPVMKLRDDGLSNEARRAVKRAVFEKLGQARRPDGWAVLNPQFLAQQMKQDVV